MIRHTALIPFLLLLSGQACADTPIQWNRGADEAARAPIQGMKGYYAPAAVKKDGDVAYFKVYASPTPTANDPGSDYALNCETREAAVKSGEGGGAQWKPPVKVLDGEPLYRLGKELCEWDRPGFFKRLMN